MSGRSASWQPSARKALWAGLLGLVCAAPSVAQEIPRVELIYEYIPFDRNCEQWRNTKIEPGWIQEVRVKVRSYQDFWDKEAPLLLGTTVSEIGKPFRRKEVEAVLTLCTVSSMSIPLLINVRRFMDGPTQRKPQPMHMFSALVFHELLHTYIGHYSSLKSSLIEKYKSEQPIVLTHLHVMATMKHVYLKLGRAEQLGEIIAWDSAADDPAYRRAWQIVNDVEGYEAFVKELALRPQRK
jgi:hypothetical protein